MDKRKKFINACKTLKCLNEDANVDTTRSKHRSFCATIRNFKGLREKVLPLRIHDVKTLINSHNQDSLCFSSFELMQHDFMENTHSNVLEYLFDYRLIGEEGPEILAKFIEGIGDIKRRRFIAQSIRRRDYVISREEPCSYKGKRGKLDLFIRDNKNKIVIIRPLA